MSDQIVLIQAIKVPDHVRHALSIIAAARRMSQRELAAEIITDYVRRESERLPGVTELVASAEAA